MGRILPMSESANAMLERAIEVAVVSHAGQTDKNGEAFILHPLRVMQAVRAYGGSVEQQTAAVLHDVIEDCDVPDDFLAARFPSEVCDLVDALTKVEGEDYEVFLRRVARTPGAVLIKEADINDNYGRLHLVQDTAIRSALKLKYEGALTYLEHLSPAVSRRGFFRITVSEGEALVLCTVDQIQVLRVEGFANSRIHYRVQNQSQEIGSQQPVKIRVGDANVTARLAIIDSRGDDLEALFDELPESVRVEREERITYPNVSVGPLPGRPIPRLFHWRIGETVRFKGPDASMVALSLSQVDLKKRSFTLEINKSPATKQFYETVPVRLSGQRVLLQAHPGAADDTLRLFAVAPPEIAAFS